VLKFSSDPSPLLLNLNCQVAINVDPSCKEAHIRLADTLSMIGREGEAKSHYEEALRIDPNYKWGHVNLGLSLERLVGGVTRSTCSQLIV
jgi:hypothetical protein